MKMRFRSFATVGVAAGVLSVAGLAGTASAGAIVIDDFTGVAAPNPWPVNLNTAGTTSINESGLGVLGGTRDIEIELESVDEPGIGFLQATIAAGAGLFDFNSTVDTDGHVSMLYNGGGSLDVDFSSQLGIQFDFAMFDYAGGEALPVMVSLSDGTNSATHQLSVNAPGPQSLMFDFDDFAGIGSLDLSSITSIQFDLDPEIGADFRIAQIATVVPAPGALAVLGLGLMGSRRRRRD